MAAKPKRPVDIPTYWDVFDRRFSVGDHLLVVRDGWLAVGKVLAIVREENNDPAHQWLNHLPSVIQIEWLKHTSEGMEGQIRWVGTNSSTFFRMTQEEVEDYYQFAENWLSGPIPGHSWRETNPGPR